MRLGVLRPALHRARKGIAGFVEPPQFRQDQPHAVPRHRMFRLVEQDPAIRLEARLQPLCLEVQQREVEARLGERRRQVAGRRAKAAAALRRRRPRERARRPGCCGRSRTAESTSMARR